MLNLNWYFQDSNNYHYQLNTYNLNQPHFDNLAPAFASCWASVFA